MLRAEARRRSRGMTIREVATAAGVSHALVGFVEKGDRPATEQSGKKIAKALGFPVREWKRLQERVEF